ncbi:MAG: putative zinc-binding metallopeptidase [Acidimicrobiales bacterium]
MAFVDGPPCANAAVIDCSWVAPAAGELCASCALTRTTPDLADPVAVGAWSSAELQKRRLVLQLLQLGLPVVPFTDDPDHGMAFDLLYSTDGSITVGHADGVITIDVGEDDDARRALRDRLGERYRTLLGHLRHEVGHFTFRCSWRRPMRSSHSERCSVMSGPITRPLSRPTMRAPSVTRPNGRARM